MTKIKVILAGTALLASLIVIFVILPNFTIPHHPHVDAIKAVKVNCAFLIEAVGQYTKKHHGAYPKSITELDLIKITTVINPVTHSEEWVVEKQVSHESQAVEFARHSKPGQVVFCPIEENDRISGFYIMGIDDKGAPVPGLNGNQLILRY